ncbi:C-terminal binding protein [Sinomonas notoginsengisoli]|uniref:C-terminal binding protein n=1 Tax=Sinomonas notoginsengisoli TaxID=1457311 RepID=UPI001F2CF716|nr:C-terminal binding protein [Sinomonas notoginsengisoli]
MTSPSGTHAADVAAPLREDATDTGGESSGASMRIVVTDWDQECLAEEEAVARSRGMELVRADCRTEEDVIRAAADARGILVQYAPVTRKVFEALPGLKAVGRYGVGVDNVDVDAATEFGVAVCNVPDYGTEDVSDHALALTMTLARGVAMLDRAVRRGDCSLAPAQPLHRLSGRVFGVVGLGLIGAATARKARGVGYSTIGFDPLHTPGTVSPDGTEVVGFDELISRADVLSLHVPLNRHTHHLIDADVLARLKAGALLINTCRGGVVDTEALVEALQSGTIRGAGLDVFEEEPLPPGARLLGLDNVVLTPHAAWYSEESQEELKRRTAENVMDAVAGQTPRNIVNPEVLQ